MEEQERPPCIERASHVALEEDCIESNPAGILGGYYTNFTAKLQVPIAQALRFIGDEICLKAQYELIIDVLKEYDVNILKGKAEFHSHTMSNLHIVGNYC